MPKKVVCKDYKLKLVGSGVRKSKTWFDLELLTGREGAEADFTTLHCHLHFETVQLYVFCLDHACEIKLKLNYQSVMTNTMPSRFFSSAVSLIYIVGSLSQVLILVMHVHPGKDNCLGTQWNLIVSSLIFATKW